jgi:glycosyltransferase involved in cell wall biosynthesis
MSEPPLIRLPMSAPTPLALCITDLDPGGAERALVQIVRRLDRSQWDPVVYCLGPRGQLADILEAGGIQTHCLDATRRDVFVVSRLAKLLKRQQPALMQTFLFHANIAGRLAATVARVPIVVSGIRVAEREQRWHLMLERRTRRLVTHHVCVSQAVAEFAKRELRLRDDCVSVIPNGVDAAGIGSAPAADLSQFGIPSPSRTLLFVGRLHPQKGVSVLLEAFHKLQAADVHLLIVGAGPLEADVRTIVRAHSLESRVHLAGQRDDVPSLMRAASALVLPSLWEGMPNVVLEAMAARLPVIATAVDGTTELIEDEETGWLCAPGSVESLEHAMRRMLDQPEAAKTIASAAQRLVSQRFTWEAMAAAYSDLWRSLLASRRSA